MTSNTILQNDEVALFPTDLSVPAGARVAYLFQGFEARFRFVPFIGSGLLDGDKCVILTESGAADEFRSRLMALGLDPDYHERSGGLLILTEGVSVEDIEPIARSILEDTRARFRFMRCLNDLSWMGDRGWTTRDFLRFEVKGHLLIQYQPVTIVCQYDTSVLEPEQMGRIIQAHQYTVTNSQIEKNADRRPLSQIIFDGMDEQLRALTQLQDLSLRLTASLCFNETLDAVIDAAMTICRADRAAISCLNEAGELPIVRSRGLSEEYLLRRRINGDDPLVTRLKLSKRPLVVEDIDHLAGLSPNYEVWRNEGIRSIVTLPLVREGEVFGLIGAGSGSLRRYTQTETDAMAILAAQAGAAITTARLLEQLREANRAKDEFLATLSHELRTPLTPVLGWVNMLSRYSASEPAIAQGLEVIERNALQQAGLINDLLDVTRIISGKIQLVREVTDLSVLICSAINQIRPQAESRSIHIELAVPPEPVLCSLDPVRVQQVLANLLGNAVKFTPEGGRVATSLQVCEDGLPGKYPGDWVRIDVADSGIGIEPEFIDHAFERFTQAHGGLNRSYGGLGLGLAITKALVEMHGGEVTAFSRGTGQGSCFTVRLPLVHPRPDFSAGSLRSLQPPSVPPGREGDPKVLDSLSWAAVLDAEPLDLRILLIEDSKDTLDMLKLWLDSFGCEVVTAYTATDGLRLATETVPDLIISDIGMPEIDGYDLIRNLRGTPSLASIPAIALTGYARKEDRDLALAAGYDAHVAKPTDMGQLINLIRELAFR